MAKHHCHYIIRIAEGIAKRNTTDFNNLSQKCFEILLKSNASEHPLYSESDSRSIWARLEERHRELSFRLGVPHDWESDDRFDLEDLVLQLNTVTAEARRKGKYVKLNHQFKQQIQPRRPQRKCCQPTVNWVIMKNTTHVSMHNQ